MSKSVGSIAILVQLHVPQDDLGPQGHKTGIVTCETSVPPQHPKIIASPSDSWTRACPSGPEASAGAPNRTTRVVESE